MSFFLQNRKKKLEMKVCICILRDNIWTNQDSDDSAED